MFDTVENKRIAFLAILLYTILVASFTYAVIYDAAPMRNNRNLIHALDYCSDQQKAILVYIEQNPPYASGPTIAYICSEEFPQTEAPQSENIFSEIFKIK